MIDLNQLTESDIQQRLLDHYEANSENSIYSIVLPDEPRPAAVLVPLFRAPLYEAGRMGWYVLLTRRSDKLIEHSGQVAFPGGRSDPEDISAEATALREAQEEIGLETQKVHILGRMKSLRTITNYHVTPVVGVIQWPYLVRLTDGEVERIFAIPLNWLADPNNSEIRYRIIPPQYASYLGSDSHPVIYFQPYDGEILWGVSAEITMRLLQALT